MTEFLTIICFDAINNAKKKNSAWLIKFIEHARGSSEEKKIHRTDFCHRKFCLFGVMNDKNLFPTFAVGNQLEVEANRKPDKIDFLL